MKRISFFGASVLSLLAGGVLFFGGVSFAQAQVCQGACVADDTKCPSGVDTSRTCADTGLFCCVASISPVADPCQSGGAGTCETPVSLACPNGGTYLGASLTCSNLGGNPGKICCKSSGSATTTTGSTSTTTTASTSATATSTSTVKCDPAKFKEYAGVCFPLNTGLSETSVASIILNLMKWMLYLFGFLAIIAFVISGIQYLSAAGNMNMIETAKRNMNYSIIGVIVALAGVVILIAIDSLLRGTAWGG